MKKQKQSEKRRRSDMLSTLPEHILNQILCFLSQEEAVRTCVLSKSWRHRGPTRTKLELCKFSARNMKTFLSFLDSSLQRYHDLNRCVKQLSLKLLFPTVHGPVELDLPSIASKAEFLQELCVEGYWDLRRTQSTHVPNLSLDHLRKLSLVRVHIADEALEMLLSRCPLIQYLHVDNCKDLRNIQLSKAHNLKHFDFSKGMQCSSMGLRIEVDAPTVETIRIVNCGDLHFHDKYFPHLKSLRLKHVLLSTLEAFTFFTSDYMPCLEELEVNSCYGFDSLWLSYPSIKRLEISCLSKSVMAIVDASNMVHFKSRNPPSIYFEPISSEWKSHVCLSLPADKVKGALTCIRELHKVLKALRQSQITLQLSSPIRSRPHIEDTTYRAYNPLAVERLLLLGDYSSFTIPIIFNALFRVCRPRYIYHGQELKLIMIRQELEERYRKSYYWSQDLVEVSKQKTGLRLKWRE